MHSRSRIFDRMARPDESGLKVVAHLRNGEVVKGHLEVASPADAEKLLDQAFSSSTCQVPIRLPASGDDVSVALEELKALFFVRTFEGRKEHREVRFFEKNPPIKGLWVGVRFYDGEYLEGIVRNALYLLVSPGFILKPPDAESNNQSLYIVKHSLTEFRVLGVTPEY